MILTTQLIREAKFSEATLILQEYSQSFLNVSPMPQVFVSGLYAPLSPHLPMLARFDLVRAVMCSEGRAALPHFSYRLVRVWARARNSSPRQSLYLV